MLIGGRIVSELINAPANRELRQLLVLLGRIYVRHIKMELAAEACNFNIHTSSRPSNYGLFMALSLSLLSRAGLQCSRMYVCVEQLVRLNIGMKYFLESHIFSQDH